MNELNRLGIKYVIPHSTSLWGKMSKFENEKVTRTQQSQQIRNTAWGYQWNKSFVVMVWHCLWQGDRLTLSPLKFVNSLLSLTLICIDDEWKNLFICFNGFLFCFNTSFAKKWFHNRKITLINQSQSLTEENVCETFDWHRGKGFNN